MFTFRSKNETCHLHSILVIFFSANYIGTTKTGPSQLGSEIKLSENELCISMYIAMCKTCFLDLKIKSRTLSIHNETYTTPVSYHITI